jgi:hypothetical protein
MWCFIMGRSRVVRKKDKVAFQHESLAMLFTKIVKTCVHTKRMNSLTLTCMCSVIHINWLWGPQSYIISYIFWWVSLIGSSQKMVRPFGHSQNVYLYYSLILWATYIGYNTRTWGKLSGMKVWCYWECIGNKMNKYWELGENFIKPYGTHWKHQSPKSLIHPPFPLKRKKIGPLQCMLPRLIR